MTFEEKRQKFRECWNAAYKKFQKDKEDLLEARFDGMTHRSEGSVMKDMINDYETFLSTILLLNP